MQPTQSTSRPPEGRTAAGDIAEAEAARIERLGVIERFAKRSYTPNASECRAVLDMHSSATKDACQARYRELVRLFHPDRTTLVDTTRAGAIFTAIRRAWEVIEKQMSPEEGQGQSTQRPNPESHYRPPHQSTEIDRILRTIRPLSPEVGFQMCNYLRLNVLRTGPTSLVQPASFVGVRGPLNRSTASVRMFDCLQSIGAENYVEMAGQMVSELERRLTPTLGLRDWAMKQHRIHQWAMSLGLQIQQASVVRTTVFECAECVTDKGTFLFPSMRDGKLQLKIEPWSFSEQVENLKRLDLLFAEGSRRLLGAEVPILVTGVCNSTRDLARWGIRVCTKGVTEMHGIQDTFDGLELSSALVNTVIKLDPERVCSATLHLEGIRKNLIIEYYPRPGAATGTVCSYDVDNYLRSSGPVTGKVILSADAHEIGRSAPPLPVGL